MKQVYVHCDTSLPCPLLVVVPQQKALCAWAEAVGLAPTSPVQHSVGHGTTATYSATAAAAAASEATVATAAAATASASVFDMTLLLLLASAVYFHI